MLFSWTPLKTSHLCFPLKLKGSGSSHSSSFALKNYFVRPQKTTNPYCSQRNTKSKYQAQVLNTALVLGGVLSKLFKVGADLSKNRLPSSQLTQGPQRANAVAVMLQDIGVFLPPIHKPIHHSQRLIPHPPHHAVFLFPCFLR